MARLNLLRFSPFRLNRLAAEFSGALAADYARFGIDIPEWRVLATLGLHDGPRSAAYVVRCTRTHKSRISRAVGHLAGLGLVERREDEADRREIMLALTPAGRRSTPSWCRCCSPARSACWRCSTRASGGSSSACSARSRRGSG